VEELSNLIPFFWTEQRQNLLRRNNYDGFLRLKNGSHQKVIDRQRNFLLLRGIALCKRRNVEAQGEAAWKSFSARDRMTTNISSRLSNYWKPQRTVVLSCFSWIFIVDGWWTWCQEKKISPVSRVRRLEKDDDLQRQKGKRRKILVIIFSSTHLS
jgi:hypothetical protein